MSEWTERPAGTPQRASPPGQGQSRAALLGDAVAAWIWPGGSVLALLLPLWFDPWAALPFEPAKVGLLQIGAALLGGLALFSLLSPRVRARWVGNLHRTRPLILAALVYAGVLSLATLQAPNPAQALGGLSDGHGLLTTLSFIAIGLILVLSRRGFGEGRRLLTALVAGSVPICLYGLAQAMGRDPLAWQSDSVSPVLSTLGRSNFLGAYLAILLPITLLWAGGQGRPGGSWGRDPRRWTVALLPALQWLILLLTQARAAWLAGAVGVALALWLAIQTERPWFAPTGRRLLVLLGVGTALMLTLSLGEELTWPADPSILAQPENEGAILDPDFAQRRQDSLSRRWIIWTHTWPLIWERPWLGHGPAHFAARFNQRYPVGSLYDGRDSLVDDPHNIFLAQLFDGGLVGATAWLGVVAAVGWGLIQQWRGASSRSQRRQAAALLGGLAAYLVQAQFNPDVVVTTAVLWWLAGIHAQEVARVDVTPKMAQPASTSIQK